MCGCHGCLESDFQIFRDSRYFRWTFINDKRCFIVILGQVTLDPSQTIVHFCDSGCNVPMNIIDIVLQVQEKFPGQTISSLYSTSELNGT